MPLTPDQLFARLEALGIESTTVTHPPLYTVADSQALRGQIEGGHTKNLFLKDKKGRLFLITVGEDAVVDLKGLHRILECGRLSFGKPDLLMETLGIIPGAVTAFAVVNDTENRVTMVIDAALMEHDRLNCHPLTNEATTTIARDDLIRFARDCGKEPLVIAVSQPADL